MVDNGIPFIPEVTTSPPYDGISAYLIKGKSCDYNTLSGHVILGSPSLQPDGTLLCLSQEEYYLSLKDDELDYGLGLACPAEGASDLKYNPIRISTGNKVQSQSFPVLSSPNAEQFSYTYNSLGASAGAGALGSKWQHDFNRSIARFENQGGSLRALPGYVVSTSYSTVDAACQSGWNEIKPSFNYDWVPQSYADYIGNNLCAIKKQNGTTWRTIHLALGPNSLTSYYYQPSYINLNRPDGSVAKFYGGFGIYKGVWRSAYGDAETVEDILDSTGAVTGYRYTNNQNEVETYDANGKLVGISAIDGSSKSLAYTNNQLTTVSDAFGRAVTFTYDAQGRIETITTEDGAYGFTYDANNNLSGITYPNGTSRTYVYDAPGFPNHLTGIIDENGNRYATWAYDAQGRAILSEHAGGAERGTLTYNANGTTTDVDALGQVRIYKFETINGIKRLIQTTGPACQSCGGSTQTTTYDTYGNPDLVTDFNGAITDYDYDLTRNLEVKRIEAKGTAQQRTIATHWHPTYRLPTQIAAPLKLTTYSYDANGLLLSRSEQATTDANGSLGFAATTVGVPRVWSYTYNANRQIATLDGPRTDVNDTTTYVHDPVNGNLLSVTNALNHTTTITNHDASGRPLRTVDANGLVTQITYTPRGWTDLIKVGTDTVYETTDLDYDGVGQLIKATLPDGSYLSYSYDAAHRLTDITDSQGNTIHYTLDLMGNRTATAVKDPSGTLKRIHTNVYNTLNKLSQSIGADKGADTQTTYYDEYDANGNLKKMRDAQGNITQYGYDAFNRLTTTLDALNGTTSYSYDGQGNLSSVTDPRGNTTSYHYDGLGNLTRLISPDTGTTNYTAYDGAGNLLSQTDAKGQTTQYQYDALNRLTQITYADNSTTVYSYDQGSNSIGRLSTVTDASGAIAYQYDLHGRITHKTQSSANNGNSVSVSIAYRYNAQGQLDQTTYPSGDVIGYGYSNGKLTSISRNGQPLLSNISFDPFGPVTGWSWGSNSTKDVSRQYDLDGQLTSYTLANATQQLGYAVTGNPTAITEVGNPANDQSYGYDALYRLTSASGPLGAQGYGYDANGNRNSATLNGNSDSYTIAATNNRLQGISGANAKTYGHDTNGNITSDGLHSYSYDARNRLTSVDTNISYTLNGLGQRTRKTVPAINTSNTSAGDANGDGIIDAQDYNAILNQILGTPASNDADCNQDGQVNVQDLVCINIKINPSLQTSGGTTYFAYDEQGQLIGEYDQSGAVMQETIYLGNLPVAVIKQGNVYRLYADHLNTPRAIADTSNTVVWRWQSDPFGTTAANEDVDGDGAKFSYNLRFPGQYFDQETGLHYNYFRDYDPSIGRYTTSDPIGLKGGLNTYAYVANNPVNYTDPWGLLPVMPLPEFGSLCGSGPSSKNIPDSFGGWDFRGPCKRHDECYGTCGADKSECDRVFYVQMLQECARHGSPGWCSAAARLYYEAVSRVGNGAYKEAQEKTCKDCKK